MTVADKLRTTELARCLRAFVDRTPVEQRIALEMVEILSDEQATDEERAAALDALMEALFPSAADAVLDSHREALRREAARTDREAVKAEHKALAENLRQFMQAKNVGPAELAARTGVGEAAIVGLMDHPSRPQRATVARFAAALGIAPSELWPQHDG